MKQKWVKILKVYGVNVFFLLSPPPHKRVCFVHSVKY